MNKEKILERLDKTAFYQELLPSLKINGKPEALGLCPFHEDKTPSLSVNLQSGLFRCFSCDAKGDVFHFYQRARNVDFPTALHEIGVMVGTESDARPRTVATFRYTDVVGNLRYVKERLEPGRNGRSKEFIFKHQKDGKWALGRGGDPVFYRLPELLKSKYAFVVEGEAKADLLNSWGLVATCLDSGANSPVRDEYIQILGGMEKVVILPDNDTPGRQYADKLASALHGKTKELKIVELPWLGESEDIIDWAKTAGNNKERLIELVKNAPAWTPKAVENHSSEPHSPGLALTRLDALFQEPEEATEWLVEGLLPSGGFSVAVAKPKVGKSTIARTLALCVARGALFLNRDTTKGAVIYLALEEKRSAIRSHFRDMGATGSEDIHIYTGGTPVDAIKQIQQAVKALKPVLVIIDPLFRLTKVKDTNDYAQVTNALDPLLRLARDTGSHVLCVHHANKMEGQGGNCVLGSSAIFGSVDTLMIMKRHENNRTMETIQRYGNDLPETILSYDKNTGIVSMGREKTEEDSFTVREAIRNFLSSQSEPVVEKVINDEVEGRTTLKRKALREMVAGGSVMRKGTGGRGDPFQYFCSQNEIGKTPEKIACSLVPTYTREQENKNPKKTGNPHGCRENACSQDFDNFQESEKSREQAILTKNAGEKDTEDIAAEPINLDMLGVEL